MKQNCICPKCDSHEIIRISGNVGVHGVGNNIFTGMTIFSAIMVARFVCANCGYSEEWIENPDDVEKLKKTFGLYSK